MTVHKPTLEVPDAYKPENSETEILWEVFTQPDCKWSDKALKLLEDNNQNKIKIHDVVEEGLIRRLFSLGFSFTPVITKDGQPFGGYPELVWYFQRSFIDPKDIRN